MKIKEYIASKIVNYIFRNGGLEAVEAKVDEIAGRIMELKEQMNQIESIPEDQLSLKIAIQDLENKINKQYNGFRRELDKVKPKPIPVTFEPIPPGVQAESGRQIKYSRDYKKELRKHR